MQILFFSQVHKLFINRQGLEIYFFLDTPTVWPRRPVVLVCWPRTRGPQKWRSPLWARIFFSCSRSSRSLLSRPLARTWLYFPSFTSFCLFKNQSGILYRCGFCIMVIIRSTLSSVSSPALLVWLMSALLSTTWAYLRPTPLIAVMAKAIFRRPSIWVLSTCKMCWNH